MRRLVILAGLLLLLVIGGGLTAQLIANQGSTLLPVLTQTQNPDASRVVLLPWKAEQFFLLIGFILFNLIGIALTLAVIVWFIDRMIRRGKAQPVAATPPSAQND
jgi:Na+/melibiose symporter-like transporter